MKQYEKDILELTQCSTVRTFSLSVYKLQGCSTANTWTKVLIYSNQSIVYYHNLGKNTLSSCKQWNVCKPVLWFA